MNENARWQAGEFESTTGRMNPDGTLTDRRAQPAPLYALIDRRQDGRPRIIGEYTDPQAARTAADLLRQAGDPVEIVLLTAVDSLCR